MKKSILLIVPALLLSVTSCDIIKGAVDSVLDGVNGALESLGVVAKASSAALGGFTATGSLTKEITYPNPYHSNKNNERKFDATLTFRQDVHQEKLVEKGVDGAPDKEPTYETHFATKDGFLGEERLSATNEVIRENVLDANFKAQSYEAVIRNPFTFTLDPEVVKKVELPKVSKAAAEEPTSKVTEYKLEGVVANKFISALLGSNTTGGVVTLSLENEKWTNVKVVDAVEESVWMSQTVCTTRLTKINADLAIGEAKAIENTLTKNTAPEGAKELQTALDGLKKDNVTITLYNDKAAPAESKTFEFTFTQDKILASFFPGIVGTDGYQEMDMLIAKQKDGTAKLFMYANTAESSEPEKMEWIWDEYDMLRKDVKFDSLLPTFGGVSADIFKKEETTYVSVPEVTKTIGKHFLTSVVEELGFATYQDFRIMCNEVTLSLKSGALQTVWLEANHQQPGMKYHGSVGLLISKNGTTTLPEATLPTVTEPAK